MVPRCEGPRWSYTVERFEDVSEMCFPDEDYDFDTMSETGVFLGAYEADRCVGLAILQRGFFRYMYLYDLKVGRAWRGKGVGARAFFGNVYMKLNGDRLPASLRVIDRGAFGMCEMYFTFDELPSGVRYIGPSAFFDCWCLWGTLHIPQGVRSIPSGAFQWVPGLESVVIPDGVRSIGASAFSGCGGLKSVTIPVSVVSIGDYAFPGGLQDVWYGGAEAQWNALVPGAAKIGLSGSVTVHFTEGGSLTDGVRAVLWAVDRSTGKVTVTGGLDAGETVYVVSYDARGRLIGLSAVSVPGGSAKLAADFDRAKLIWTGADGAPRSEHGALQQAAEG